MPHKSFAWNFTVLAFCLLLYLLTREWRNGMFNRQYGPFPYALRSTSKNKLSHLRDSQGIHVFFVFHPWFFFCFLFGWCYICNLQWYFSTLIREFCRCGRPISRSNLRRNRKASTAWLSAAWPRWRWTAGSDPSSPLRRGNTRGGGNTKRKHWGYSQNTNHESRHSRPTGWVLEEDVFSDYIMINGLV